MPIQILPQEQSLSELLGKGLGAGLSTGLESLAQQNLQQMMQQRQRQQQLAQGSQFWSGLLNLPADHPTVRSFASAPDALQKSLLDRLEGLDIQTAPQQPEQTPGTQFDTTPTQAIYGTEPTDALPAEQEPQSAQMIPSESRSSVRVGAAPIERRHQEILGQRERETAFKRVQKDIDTIKEESRVWEKIEPKYQQAIKLASKKDVQIGPLTALAEGIKFGENVSLLDFMQTSNTQQLRTLINELAQGAAGAFGTKRLTNLEVDLYRDSLIRLANTPEGMKSIARRKLIEGKAIKAKKKAVNSLVGDYESRKEPIPFDILDRADTKIDRQLNRYKQQVINEIQGANPEDYENPQEVTFNFNNQLYKYHDGAFWPETEIQAMKRAKKGK